MSFRQQPLGGQIQVVFSSPFANERIAVVVKDGSVSLDSPVISLLTGEVYKLVFTPTSTGVYDIIVDDVVVSTVEVTSRSIFDFLQNIEDVSLGSWDWDKSTKTMTLYRQDGSELAKYTTDDTLERAYQQINI